MACAAFSALACLAALVALGLRPPRILALLARTMHSSDQLPVLVSMLLLAGFGALSVCRRLMKPS